MHECQHLTCTRPEANHSRTDASTGDTLSSLPLSPSPCCCPCPSGHFHSLRGSHWFYLQNTARVWPDLATPSHHSHLGAGKASSLVSDSSQGPLSVYSLPRARGVFFKKRIPLRRPLHPQCKLLAGPSTQPHPAHGSGQAAPGCSPASSPTTLALAVPSARNALLHL